MEKIYFLQNSIFWDFQRFFEEKLGGPEVEARNYDFLAK